MGKVKGVEMVLETEEVVVGVVIIITTIKIIITTITIMIIKEMEDTEDNMITIITFKKVILSITTTTTTIITITIIITLTNNNNNLNHNHNLQLIKKKDLPIQVKLIKTLITTINNDKKLISLLF